MTLTHSELGYVITDVTVPSIVTIGFCLARLCHRITPSFFNSYWMGVGVAALWEIPFGLAGNSLLQCAFPNPLGFSAHLCHCFWDSLVFTTGIWLVNYRNRNRWPGLVQLLGLVVWGIVIILLITAVLGHRYWYFTANNRSNLEMFTIQGVAYTCYPFLAWILGCIAYLTGVMTIIDKWGPLHLDRIRTVDIPDRTVNLLAEPDVTVTIERPDTSTTL